MSFTTINLIMFNKTAPLLRNNVKLTLKIVDFGDHFDITPSGVGFGWWVSCHSNVVAFLEDSDYFLLNRVDLKLMD